MLKRFLYWLRNSSALLNSGYVLLFSAIAVTILAPILAPFDFDQIRDGSEKFEVLEAPGSQHPFGTNSQRFDVLSRTILGFQPALLSITLSIPIGLLLGVVAGLLAGYFRGALDSLFSFLSDLLFTFPPLVVSMVVSLGLSAGSSSFFPPILAASVSTGLAFSAKYFRVVRAEVLQLSSAGFIQISKATGISNTRILFLQVLPNAAKVLPVVMSRHAADVVLVLAGLGFLGIGISPEVGAEWGYDLSLAVSDVVAGVWWTSLFPSIALLTLVLAFSLIAEWYGEEAVERASSHD